MSTQQLRTQESIARDHFHDADFLGTDHTGAAHYWSIYHQSIVVIQGDSHATVNLPVCKDGHCITSLRDWIDYTERVRGGFTELRVSSSLGDHFSTVTR
jgi:hypothetical protein